MLTKGQGSGGGQGQGQPGGGEPGRGPGWGTGHDDNVQGKNATNPKVVRASAGSIFRVPILMAEGFGATAAAGIAGDLIVTVDIAVPKDLTTKAKKALEELAKETADFDPRAELMRKAGSFAAKGSK